MPDRPIVLVAAEPVVQRLVHTALDSRGFRVRATTAPRLGEELVADLHPDVILLDAPRPDEAARYSVRRLATGDPVPIIVTSGQGTAATTRALLDAGADDVLARPFDPVELAARVRSLVRRRGGQFAAGRRPIGRALVDLDRREVRVDGRVRLLTRSDWRLLVRLLDARGEVVGQDELLEAAFGREAVGDVSALQSAIGRLRRKLGVRPGESGPILTLRGFGYALRARP